MLSTSTILADLNLINPYQELYTYISANKSIPNFIAGIKKDDDKRISLLEAIKTGDAHHPIFNDPNCYLYLLSLIKNNEISFEIGMTTYVYLLALMQYTGRQPIKEIDKDVKILRNITISSLSRDGKLTTEGKLFTKSIAERLKNEKHFIDLMQLEDYIVKLVPSEQWLIRVPYEYAYKRNDLNDNDSLFMAITSNVPFLHIEEKVSGKLNEAWIPSVSLIYYIIKTISPSPLKMKFCYGDIGIQTLKKLHQQDLHPVSLYGLHVKSNPKKADGYRCGPFAMYLHDIGHVYWGSKLNKEQRYFIFNEFIPKMESLIQIAANYNDEPVVNHLKKVIEKVFDFDLTAIADYRYDTRFSIYLARSFGHSDQSLYGFCEKDENGRHIEFQDIGDSVQDRVYFLLNRMFYELPKDENNKVWKSMFRFIQTGDYHRQEYVANAIDSVAYSVANKPKNDNFFHFNLNHQTINWKKIKEKIKNVKDSESLWKELKQQNDIADIINQEKIQIFHPYVTMTPVMIQNFKHLVENRIEELRNCAYRGEYYQFNGW